MAGFSVSRSIVIGAPPAAVHALVDDLRAHQRWSPWQELDPQMVQEYLGPDSGEGAKMTWSGNRRAGAGSQEILASSPDRVEIAVRFLKPFRSESVSTIAITPAADGTEVTWTMVGENTGLAAVFMKVFSMDKAIGKDFERGLAKLKAVAEAG
ncbi:SRPBCC family protein [Nocardioides limicola]|uniref:SRPBCC family protein n=1 Tax=Nocardioides limicola TaxID=2803368 RepID=UPI00193BDCC6|nr:SRPBCC family protein [Nocardioides sp. DJM-14]